MSKKVEKIHIIGICGIGMSAIAQYLLTLGYLVQGSDKNLNSASGEILVQKGIEISHHNEANINIDITVVIRSSAIKDSNIEIIKAKTLGIKIMTRSAILTKITQDHSNVISITGAHGKTTTTTITAEVLEALDINPTVFAGGIMQKFNNNFVSGDRDLMVVEADESDGTFLDLKTDIAVITNIDFEHAEYYRDFQHMLEKYDQFANAINVKQVIICGDDNGCNQLKINKPLIKYGFDISNDIYAKDLVIKTGMISFTAVIYSQEFKNFTLKSFGKHNVLNALCSIAIAICYKKLTKNFIYKTKETLRQFHGITRRFNILSQKNGITVVDDYAHHPTEIKAVIEAAANVAGRVIAIIQPHRYTRLKALMVDFISATNSADIVILIPVYSAGEKSIDGINSEKLYSLLKDSGKTNCFYVRDFNELSALVQSLAIINDYILFMGAGDITIWARIFSVEPLAIL